MSPSPDIGIASLHRLQPVCQVKCTFQLHSRAKSWRLFFVKAYLMTWLRLFFTLLAALGTSSSPALTPPFDTRPGFFAGDWIGTGADDQLCFIRLQPDGNGTVLVSSASGDWLGARIRWRNQRQSLVLIEVSPEVSLFPAEPARRLMPLSGLTLRSGINQTLQLKPGERSPVCELQLHNRVLSRSEQAGILLDSPADVRKSDGRK